MSEGRRAFTLTRLLNGKVLAAGGFNTNGATASADIYDPATAQWTPTNPLQTPRGLHSATLLPDGRVLVAGGEDLQPTPPGANPVDSALASAEIYDPATGQWTPTGSLGQVRQEQTAMLLPNGKVLVAAGEAYFDGLFPTSAELYDPASGKWSPTLPLLS